MAIMLKNSNSSSIYSIKVITASQRSTSAYLFGKRIEMYGLYRKL